MQLSQPLPTFPQLLVRQAQSAPHRAALVCGGRVLTYGELNADANRIAHYLLRRGVGRDTLVPVCLDRSIELVVAIHGILKAGAAYVPLDPALPADRLRFLRDDCAAPLLITASRLAPLFAGGSAQLLLFDEFPGEFADPLASYPSTDPPSFPAPADLAYVIYTSGSTGQPKGVLVEHRGAVNCLAALQELAPVEAGDTCLFKINHAFDASLTELFAPVFQGGRLAILPAGEERDPARILVAAVRHAVTHLIFVPSALQAFFAGCSAADLARLRRLKFLGIGGEPAGRALVDRLRSCFPQARLFNLYGPTEAAIAVTAYDLRRDFAAPSAPLGRPLPNVTAAVLDPSLAPAAAGAEGELYLGGVAVARGYLNRPDLTATHFLPDPRIPGGRLYRTGDLGRVLPGGDIEYLGRRDRQVKLRGYRIELGEIENRLAAHPAIADAAVMVQAGAAGGECLAAYYVASPPGAALDPADLRHYLLQSLPDYMVPTAWRPMPALPITANGKRDLQALPPVEPIDPPADSRPASAPPQSPMAQAIAQAWAAELGVAAVGDEDDFFALGGHSLSAARVASALRAALHKEVSVTDLYRAPTRAGLERLLLDAPDLDPPEPPAAAHRRGFPLAYQQLDLWLLAKSHAPNLNVLSRKRVAGRLDHAALTAALARVVAQHPALRYRISPRQPRQSVGGCPPVNITERDLSHLPPDEKEQAALASIAELARYTAWTPPSGPAAAPLVRLRLLRLAPEVSELQACMPHIVSDEASLQVFFDELSRHYCDPQAGVIGEEATYDAFVREQRAALRASLAPDRAFWEAYLDGASLIVFPESEVIPPGRDNDSVYMEWPAPEVEALAAFARMHQAALPDLLHALALAAVAPYVEPSPRGGRPAPFYTPRSTRTSAAYDRTIGPLARLDCLKADVADASDLLVLARRLRQAKRETEPHQPCPAVVKSAGLHRHRWEKMPTRDRFSRLAAWIVPRIFPQAQLDHEVVLAQARMLSLRRAPVSDYALVVNVLNSFLAPEDEGALFGFDLADTERLPSYQPPVQRVLEIYFLREPGRRPRYLIMLNGDLSPAFRLQLGAAMRQAARQAVNGPPTPALPTVHAR